MAEFFCTVIERGVDRRMTVYVDADVHEQAMLKAQDAYEQGRPRKIGEIRKYDLSAMRM